MKQLYYVVQTLLHGRNANVIKIVSLGLGLMMSILYSHRSFVRWEYGGKYYGMTVGQLVSWSVNKTRL